MALVCDYCGDVTASGERVSVAFGHNQEIALKGSTAREWFYYCEGECADTVKDMLTNLRLFALHGEGSGLVWALTEQAVAPVAEEVKPAGAPPPEAEAKPEGFDWDKATPFEERQQRRTENEGRTESEEEKKHKANLSLGWWLQRGHGIPLTELRARQKAGTAIVNVIEHSGSHGNLHKNGIATLEDAATMTEVEFAGLPGVGSVILSTIKKAMKAHSIVFKPGPTAENLGAILREHRQESGLDLDEAAGVVAKGLGAPEKHPDEDWRSGAVRGARTAIRSAERGNKPLAPIVLDVLSEAFNITREEMLAAAMELEEVSGE